MYVRILTIFGITKLVITQAYDMQLEWIFLVGSRGNLANYVLPFQIPKPPKKVLNGENKGGAPLLILAQPLWSYLPNIQVGVGKYDHTQCPIRTGHLTTLSNQNCWVF